MVYRYNPYVSAVYYGGNDYRDYIAHFRLPGTPNKDHKYIKKIGEGAKAVYIYATNAAKNVGRSVGKFVDNNITGSTYKKNAAKYGAGAINAYNSAKRYQSEGNYNAQAHQEREGADYSKRASYEMGKYRKTLAGRLTSAIDKTRSSFRAAKTLVGNVLGKIGGTLSSIGSGILSRGRSIVSSILGAPSTIKGKLADDKRHKNFEKSFKTITKMASKAPKKKKAVGEVFGSTPLATPYGASLNRKIEPEHKDYVVDVPLPKSTKKKTAAEEEAEKKLDPFYGFSDEDKRIWETIQKSGVKINKTPRAMVDEYKKRKSGPLGSQEGSTTKKSTKKSSEKLTRAQIWEEILKSGVEINKSQDEMIEEYKRRKKLR